MQVGTQLRFQVELIDSAVLKLGNVGHVLYHGLNVVLWDVAVVASQIAIHLHEGLCVHRGTAVRVAAQYLAQHVHRFGQTLRCQAEWKAKLD